MGPLAMITQLVLEGIHNTRHIGFDDRFLFQRLALGVYQTNHTLVEFHLLTRYSINKLCLP